MKTLGDITIGTLEDLIAHKVIPDFLCRKCNINYTFEPEESCDSCIEEIIEEGE